MTNFKYAAIILLASWGSVFGQVNLINRSNGRIDTIIAPPLTTTFTGNSEAFRFQSGLITQLDVNDTRIGSNEPFDFLSGSQWLSMGRFTTPGQTLYGFRAQRAGRGLLIGYKGARQTSLTARPTLGSAVIEWVGDSVNAGDLTFATSPSSTNASPIQVMKMRANATSVLSTASVFEMGGALFNTGSPVPKLEISTFDGSEGLLVSTTNPGLSRHFAARFSNIRNTSNFLATSNSSTNGIEVIARSNNLVGTCIGIDASVANTNISFSGSTSNIAIVARSLGGAASNIGILSQVNSNQRSGAGIQISASCEGQNNYGLFSFLSGNEETQSINHGIYSSAIGFNAFAGYFAGRIFSTSALVISDVSLKQNIVKESGMLAKLKNLNPVNYTFKQEREKTGLNLPTELQHGFIAQELEKVFPELVSEVTNPIYNDSSKLVGKKQIKAVNYTELISVLVSAINELNAKLEAQENQNSPKTVVIDNTSKFTKSEQERLLSASYSLAQNRPNPFYGQTTIDYVLPENETNASILLLNLNGQLIQEYKLNEPKGSITIDGSRLTKGIYLYSLVSNNLEIATKKMIVK